MAKMRSDLEAETTSALVVIIEGARWNVYHEEGSPPLAKAGPRIDWVYISHGL